MFGSNANFGSDAQRREQEAAQAITSYVRYSGSPTMAPYVGLQYNHGGETLLNGIPQADPSRSNRVMLGIRWAAADQQIVNLRLARDTYVRSSLGMDEETTLRWTRLF